jgi:hypothetical protein
MPAENVSFLAGAVPPERVLSPLGPVCPPVRRVNATNPDSHAVLCSII